MKSDFSSRLFLFILLLSPLTIAGSFQNAFALTPVADLTGEWSGFAQVYFTGTPCETSGKVNGYFTQNENDLSGEFSFVPTTGNPDCGYEPFELVVDGTIDGSRITLYDHSGITFSGWYASSGIKLDFAADWLTGTTQLSPTGFTPPAFAPKDTDGDGIPDSKDACPSDPAPRTVDGCPEKNTQEKAEAEKAVAEQAAAAEAKAAQEKAAAEKAAQEYYEAEKAAQEYYEAEKAGTLQVHEGSVTITTADGTVVDSNELKIGQTIQTGENAGTNVQIEIGDGATMNLKENTRVSTVGIISTDGENIVITNDIDQDLVIADLTKTRPGLLDKELKPKHILAATAGPFVIGFFLPELLIATGVIGAVTIVGYTLYEGSLYFATTPSKDSNGQNQRNVIVTPDGIFVHKKTEFTVTVEDETTKLEVIEGEVVFVPFDTSRPTTVITAGNSLSISDEKIEKTSLDTNSVDRWWEVSAEQESPTGGGCLIATAAFGSELAPQVQILRETRDNVVMRTQSGAAFMTAFNSVYYSFAPTVATWERESPVFKEIAKATITPLITTLSILNYVDIDSEAEMIGYGISIILMNIGMYFVAPAFVIIRLKQYKK